jgi:hypothetical protein
MDERDYKALNRDLNLPIVEGSFLSFEDCLREEFLVNTQNYPSRYHELFRLTFNRAYVRYKNQQSFNQLLVMCCAGDFVKEVGGDWIKVIRVEGRNIYLDESDGLNCLDIDDVIAWKRRN